MLFLYSTIVFIVFVDSRMGFGKRIKEARDFLDWDQSLLASKSGVPQPTTSAIETRDSERSKYAEQLVQAFPPEKISHHYLRTGEGVVEAGKPCNLDHRKSGQLVDDVPTNSALNERANAMVVISQYDTGGAMGRGLVLADQPGIIKSWQVTPEWVRKNVPHCTSPENLCIVTGFGDSMLGMYNPGDPLLADKGVTECSFDGVYFFRVGNEGFIKRLQRIPQVGGGVIIKAKSSNKEYDTFDIVEGMDFEVFAKILTVWKSSNY